MWKMLIKQMSQFIQKNKLYEKDLKRFKKTKY